MFRVVGAIIGGGLTAGLCDFVFASIFYPLRAHIPVERIWQSVASGVLGKAAFDGGYAAAALGVSLHFFIATVMAAAFVMVTLKLKFLSRYWLIFGPLYGIFLFYAMQGVVLQLSNVPTKPDLSHLPIIGKNMINFYSALGIHAVVGTVIALFSRRAQPRE
ncbi:MAG: hypothetical protein U1E87_10810 [Alphaproteobacteria bacterium]